DSTNDAGETAAKRVRKTRVAKTASKEALAIPPLDDAPAAAATPAPAPPPPAPAEAPAAAPAAETAGGNDHQANAQPQAGQDGAQQRNDGQRPSRRERFKNRRDRQRERYRDGGMPDDGGN